MSEVKLAATARTEFGKGAARRIRRDHNIPAVLYGRGVDPIHVTLPGHETMMALKAANALLSVDLDGTTHLALAKDIQRDPIKPVIEHVDLVIVRRGEKVVVDIPIHVEGEAGPDTVVTVESQTLEVSVEATDIPERLHISVEGLAAGTQVRAADVALPAGADLVSDPDTLVVNVSAQMSQEALDADLADADASPAGEAAATSDSATGDDQAATD